MKLTRRTTAALLGLTLFAGACADRNATEPAAETAKADVAATEDAPDEPAASDPAAADPAASDPAAAGAAAADTPAADAPAAADFDVELASEPAMVDPPEPVRSERPTIGELPPNFTLKDIDGNEHSLSDYMGKTVVLEWINHGCPYVRKHYAAGNFQMLQKAAAADGVIWLSICSSAPGKQGHRDNAAWKVTQEKKGAAPTAVLPDANGKIGRLYQAKKTPTMYVIAADGKLAYMGAIDDDARAKGDAIAGARNYVTEALAAVKAGKQPEVTKAPAYG